MSDRAQAFNALGRNKRSIGLNLKDEAARKVFYRLAERADVVMEGFRPGVVKRLGVDYETVSAINPRIVYCSLSGYGQTGPYASLVGHDLNYISIGGGLGGNGGAGRAGGRPSPRTSSRTSPAAASTPPSPSWRRSSPARRPAAASTSTWR